MRKSWLLRNAALLMGLAMKETWAMDDPSTADGLKSMEVVPRNDSNELSVWKTVEYVIFKRQPPPEDTIDGLSDLSPAPAHKRAPEAPEAPKTTPPPVKRQQNCDPGTQHALADENGRLHQTQSLLMASINNLRESADGALRQANTTIMQANSLATDAQKNLTAGLASASAAVEAAQLQAKNQVAAAQLQAKDEITSAQSAMNASLSSSIESAQASASDAIASALSLARNSVVSAQDSASSAVASASSALSSVMSEASSNASSVAFRAASQVQAAQADVTAVRGDASNLVAQIQSSTLPIKTVVAIVVAAVIGAIVFTAAAVFLFVRVRRKRREERDVVEIIDHPPTQEEDDGGSSKLEVNDWGPSASRPATKKKDGGGSVDFTFLKTDKEDKRQDRDTFMSTSTATEPIRDSVMSQDFRLSKPPSPKVAKTIKLTAYKKGKSTDAKREEPEQPLIEADERSEKSSIRTTSSRRTTGSAGSSSSRAGQSSRDQDIPNEMRTRELPPPPVPLASKPNAALSSHPVTTFPKPTIATIATIAANRPGLKKGNPGGGSGQKGAVVRKSAIGVAQ